MPPVQTAAGKCCTSRWRTQYLRVSSTRCLARTVSISIKAAPEERHFRQFNGHWGHVDAYDTASARYLLRVFVPGAKPKIATW